MYTKAIFIFTVALSLLSFSSYGIADKVSCTSLTSQKLEIEQNVKKLQKEYPEVSQYYGFSEHMAQGTTHDSATYFIIRVTDSINNCAKIVENKTCDHAAGKIIKLIKSGLKLCLADKVASCGMC